MRINVKKFSLDEIAVAATALVSILIGLLSFVGFLSFKIEQMIQIVCVGVGIIMSHLVYQAKERRRQISIIESEIKNFTGGNFTLKVFSNAGLGFKYMTEKIVNSKSSIDHVSLSAPIPRWYPTFKEFNKAIKDAAINNEIKFRYIANFCDNARLDRVKEILSNPDVHRYFVGYYDQNPSTNKMINFMIVDGEELIFGVPSFKEQDAMVAINSKDLSYVF